MILIEKLIVEAMKNHDEVRKEALRNLKAAVMNFKTQPGHPEYNDVAEINVLKKMVKQLDDSIVQFKSAGREDLAEHEEQQLSVLREFLPAEATKEEILSVIDRFGKLDKTKMGACIKFVKQELPAANGKLVSDLVKEKIGC